MPTLQNEQVEIEALSSNETERVYIEGSPTMDAEMWRHLPKLMTAVKNHWQGYQLDPSKDRINSMREEVQLLLYWLARRIAKQGIVRFAGEHGARQQARLGLFDGMSATDLQGQIYHDVCSKKTVTQLVEGANGNLVGYLTRILSNEKINIYRRAEVRMDHVVMAQDLLPADEGHVSREAAEDVVSRGDYYSVDSSRVAEALQCMEQFSTFIEAENLNDKLKTVAWALWMAEPLTNKNSDSDKETSAHIVKENKANSDIALAKEVGIPKSTFDRYKKMSVILVERFRQDWDKRCKLDSQRAQSS